jgi:hypothetical protein
LADMRAAVAAAEAIADPQLLFPVLSQRAAALALSGRLAEAARTAEKLLGEWRNTSYIVGDWAAPLASTVAVLGRGQDFLDFLDVPVSRVHTRWLDAAKLVANGEFSAAADIYAEMGTLVDEAAARLRSGRESEVRRARKFFRSVGAVQYVKEAEALLAATA